MQIPDALKWLARRVRHPVRTCYQVLCRLPAGKLRRRLLGFPSPERISDEVKALAGKGDLWVFPAPSCPWGYLFQRPHQFARALARSGRIVLYCVDHSSMLTPDMHVRGLQQVETGLYLFNDGENGASLSALHGALTVWQYWPHQAGFVRALPPQRVLIYDVIDDLDVFEQYADIRQDFDQSFRSADVVLATSQALSERATSERGDVVRVPNAVCYEDFADPTPVEWPEVTAIRESTETIVTYYGALADWVDFGLIRQCAERLPGWTFLLVGHSYPGVAERERLDRTEGVIALPPAPYERLPWLLTQSDVAIIPFKVNEITRNTSPVKLFEYMAAGKPVVSTDLPECRQYAPVAIARDADEFVAEMRRAREQAGDPDFVASLRACARENTWDARLDRVTDALRTRSR